MSKRSKNGSRVLTGLNPSQKAHLRALAFTLTTHDLELAGILEIVGNSRLTKDGPTGVIVFIPNASVGNDSLIEFPMVKEIANDDSEIANAKGAPDETPPSPIGNERVDREN